MLAKDKLSILDQYRVTGFTVSFGRKSIGRMSFVQHSNGIVSWLKHCQLPNQYLKDRSLFRWRTRMASDVVSFKVTTSKVSWPSVICQTLTSGRRRFTWRTVESTWFRSCFLPTCARFAAASNDLPSPASGRWTKKPTSCPQSSTRASSSRSRPWPTSRCQMLPNFFFFVADC